MCAFWNLTHLERTAQICRVSNERAGCPQTSLVPGSTARHPDSLAYERGLCCVTAGSSTHKSQKLRARAQFHSHLDWK